ncbi:AAA family ATPase [Allostreptomyces psammosilenae]|uniref:AAA family ATPase n=1 Tax=Allostreptomyces psammosilenae TaxID=1892865 RepID=UPI0015CA50EB|nr:AAA family ATPase [Allostreptomyces psammosilenae]
MPGPAEAAEAAVRAILGDTLAGRHRGVVVDSPPGAGKSTLVVRAALELAGAGERLAIVAQTNSQVDDLVDRIAAKAPDLPVGRLLASDGVLDPALAERRPNVVGHSKPAQLADLPVVVSTAARFEFVTVEQPWRHAIVDEAYQMRADALLVVARLFERALFVGDPGQLDPFSTVDTGPWTGLPHDPSRSAVGVLLEHNPGLPQHRLPVSWRLPYSAARLVSEAFYPRAPFVSGTGEGERRLLLDRSATPPELGVRASVDRVVEAAAESGWGLLELPAGHTPRTDPEAVGAVTQVVAAFLARGGRTVSERGGGELTADRVAVGTAHRDQAAAVRARLLAAGVPVGPDGVTVDTANRLQGREFDVTVVLHPLSGRPDASAFHLESGRLCVLASRHRHACVVVSRAGVGDLLADYPAVEPVALGVPAADPDGWEANETVLRHLERHRVSW